MCTVVGEGIQTFYGTTCHTLRLLSLLRRGVAQECCCQVEACSCGYGDRSPGSRGQQGQEKSHWLGWGRQTGRRAEGAFKTPAPPAGEQWCVKASSRLSCPAVRCLPARCLPAHPLSGSSLELSISSGASAESSFRSHYQDP